MRVNTINLTNFKGKIIDVHAHTGNWYGVEHTKESLDTFIKNPLSNGDSVEKIIISNADCLTCKKNELNGNLDILNISSKSPKILPLAVCQPKTGNVKNIKNLFEQYPNQFVGLKFHPDEHQIMASDKAFIPYLEFARDKNLPCLFHCGISWENGELVAENFRYSSPKEIYTAAQRIPNTPVIMAHLGAGGEIVHEQAIDVLIDSIEASKAKLYADISWVDIDNPEKPTILNVIEKLRNTSKGDMTERLLFGSDAPIAEFTNGKNGLSGIELYEKTITDTKRAIKNKFGKDADNIINKIFYKNAEKLFLITEKTDKIINKNKKSKKIAIFAGITTFIAAGIYLIATRKNENKV